jgi:hypothetical protein
MVIAEKSRSYHHFCKEMTKLFVKETWSRVTTHQTSNCTMMKKNLDVLQKKQNFIQGIQAW